MFRTEHTAAVRTCLLVGASVFLSCLSLVNTESDVPFSMRRAAPAGDTISPYCSLEIRFSYPVLYPDSVRFVFQPAFNEYQVQFNRSLDTVTMLFSMPLQGNTAYRLNLASTVESIDGLLLHPQDDTIAFRTFPLEQEPNDARAMADVFNGTIFGAVSTANDTDWFTVADSTLRSFYLVSNGSSSFFDIRDAAGKSITPQEFAAAETLSAPADFTLPLYLVVYAYSRSNGGYYKLANCQ